ncbi:Structural maintenance of chromosomes protein 2 [Glugoides intestinalis]
MFIKDIIMDGFKCYTDKTTIRNIDKYFTAITGMNGSGKSNIIDAIIFTLDLTSAKLMRVLNLKELININRKECTVTIVFDNSDKSKSPAGYESYDFIELSRSHDSEGKSKYKINGHNATKSSIENLCKSIGITNDFIVMQGQITKIINMRSPDLKAMLEETAGTRSYSQEREKSLEMLTKKEFKLKEAREHLKRTISPFFDQLKKEKQLYEENKSFEANRKAYSEELSMLEVRMAEVELSEKAQEMREMATQLFNSRRSLKEVERRINEVNSMKPENVYELSNEINKERSKIEELSQQDPSEQIFLKTAVLEEALKVLEKPMRFDLIELKEKEEIYSKELVKGSSGDKTAEFEKIKERICKKEAELGMIETEIQEKYFESRLQPLRELDVKIKKWEANRKRIEEVEETILVMRSKICYPLADGKAIEGVFGTFDENFIVKEDSYKEAIMTILGGKAKFVLCRDEEIASKVIQSSEKKISCIPLNKILFSEARRVPYRSINALEAIEFDKKLEKAFKHVFGGFYIFEDKQQAAACCFECKVICVTLDGTVYDPKGTLTGGKQTFRNEVTRLRDICELEEQISNLKEETPRQEEIIGFQMIKEKEDRKEVLSREVTSLKQRAETLKDLCFSKVDVRKELQTVRDAIVEASKEEKSRTKAKREYEILKQEIEDLSGVKDKIGREIANSSKRHQELLLQQKQAEIEESTRRASVRMIESLDEQRKSLIKATVQLRSRIIRLHEEMKPILEQVEKHQQEENQANRQSRKERIIEEEVISFMKEEFEIGENVLQADCGDHGLDYKKAETRIEILKEGLKRKRVVVGMDPKNYELLEKNVAAVQDLEEKIRKLEKDRDEIHRSIEILNEIGMKENQRAFDHVNNTLRTFLGYFLKNSDVMISSDFEIRVKVGTWKNSLQELSGGQKSLIALCLIFSMLTFKPAPFYIFDEIDAALDLNYTQAIGEIIQKEFHGAQFIVISLKNNMFDNANKIFQVFMQDHKSKIMQIK